MMHKIQVFKDDKKQSMTSPWNNGGAVQFSVPPKTAHTPPETQENTPLVRQGPGGPTETTDLTL